MCEWYGIVVGEGAGIATLSVAKDYLTAGSPVVMPCCSSGSPIKDRKCQLRTRGIISHLPSGSSYQNGLALTFTDRSGLERHRRW
jgi:hypothetical protein